MNRSTHLIAVLFMAGVALAAPFEARAQFWDRIKDAAGNAAQHAVEQEVREKTVRVVHGAFDVAENAAKCVVTDRACIERAKKEGQEVVLTDEQGGVYVDENGNPISDPSQVPADMKPKAAPAGQGLTEAVAAKLLGGEKAAPVELSPNAAQPLDAPQIQYEVVTEFDAAGMGALGTLFGGENQGKTVTYRSDGKRVDEGEQSIIFDLSNGRYILLNHAERTYTALTFEEMMQRMKEMTEELAESSSGQGAQAARDGVSARFDMQVERTGATRRINGVPAEQMVMVIEAQAASSDAQAAAWSGAFTIVYEMWMSEQVAGFHTIQAFNEEVAGVMRDQVASMAGSFQQGMSGGLGAMFGPGMKASMKKAAEEMQALDGLAVRKTMYMVMVPEGEAVNLEQVLHSSGTGPGAANASAAVQQSVMASITTHVSGLHEVSPDASVLEIPAGYRQVDMF